MYVEEKNPGQTNIDEAGEVLLEAADYIERHGWCQVIVQNSRSDVCVMGALFYVGKERRYTALRKLREYLGVVGVDNWNDAPGRTKEQVIAALRAAALS